MGIGTHNSRIPSNSNSVVFGAMGLATLCSFPLPAAAGTGGTVSAATINEHGSKWAKVNYRPPSLTIPQDSSQNNSPIQNLKFIKTRLVPSITELSKLLGVSRQTIYDWLSTGSISSKHEENIALFADAAKVFANESLQASPQFLRRKIGGKSFWERIKNGELPKDVAESLVGVLKREAQQTKLLRARNNRVEISEILSDETVPHLGESQ